MNLWALKAAGVAVIAFTIAGCKGNAGPVGPGGPAGPELTGDLGGWAYLVDPLGNRAKVDSGITVTADSTSYSAKTDSTGKWIIHGLPTGTYHIMGVKAGYGVYKSSPFVFVGGQAMTYFGNMNLCTIPSFIVSGLTADTLGGGKINLKANFVGPYPAANNEAIVFMSNSADVSSDPTKYITAFGMSAFNSASLSATILATQLQNSGIAPGSAVFIVAYAAGASWNSYYDFQTNRYLYSSLNPVASNIVSVTAP